jgi:glucan 1,3-beta-glucosidase
MWNEANLRRDHDIDDSSNTQITLYAARGLHIESTVGNFWL